SFVSSRFFTYFTYTMLFRSYSGYDRFDFEIPVANNGDAYDRAVVRIEEMRQSLRIIEQCVKNMPAGPYMSDHPQATPPIKKKTRSEEHTSELQSRENLVCRL